jgi:hypothetical protein
MVMLVMRVMPCGGPAIQLGDAALEQMATTNAGSLLADLSQVSSSLAQATV